MSIPKKIQVGSNPWKVEYKWRVVDEDGMECDALADPKTNTIYIVHGLTKQEQLAAFLHELGHAASNELNLYLAKNWSSDLEELFVEAFVQLILSRYTLRLKK